MNLKDKIKQTELKDDQIAIFWLGQAGFLVKDARGRRVVIDPYLTDCGERLRGFKRLSPKLIEPSSLEADYYITTHLHFDHFDFDAIPEAAQNRKTKFFGPSSCYEAFKEIAIDQDRIKLLEEGVEIEEDGVTIIPVYADHGEMALDAVGICLKMGKHKLYFSGDTAYRPERLSAVVDYQPDVAILAVNGAFVNLNAEEGATVASLVGAKLAIHCHVCTLREHGGDLAMFEKSIMDLAPSCEAYFMYQGECIVL